MDMTIALLCSDIHLSHKPPLFRSSEPHWYQAMLRPLQQLSDLAASLGNPPILCAGDVFDRWNSPAELINFAIRELPVMYSIPGQHDLPNHSYQDIKRSAYWTLVEAGKLINLKPGANELSNGVTVTAAPWRKDLPPPIPKSPYIQIALIHAYCGRPDMAWPGMPEEGLSSAWAKKTKGFDLAVFGDNHIGFTQGPIYNCGSLMRRTATQITYKPSVGILKHKSDGKLDCTRFYLDTSKDNILVPQAASTQREDPKEIRDFSDLLDELETMGTDPLNFLELVHHYIKRVPDPIRQVILNALGEG